MGELKETISVKKLEPNNYEITRVTIDVVNMAELTKIYHEVKKGYDEAKKQLDEIPEQIEVRKKALNTQLLMLSDRIKAIGGYVPQKEEIKEAEVVDVKSVLTE